MAKKTRESSVSDRAANSASQTELYQILLSIIKLEYSNIYS